MRVCWASDPAVPMLWLRRRRWTPPPTRVRPPLASDATRTPRRVGWERDKYVIGQKQAKRAVAIALRNRMRRQKLSPELAEEVVPKNIIMIGPTGVGKTKIARTLDK